MSLVEKVVFAFKQGLGKSAGKYLKEPIACNLVSYGNNIVAASKNEVLDVVAGQAGKFEGYHCVETPDIHWLNERLIEKGHKSFMAEYDLPDINKMSVLSRAYKMRMLKQGDLGGLPGTSVPWF